MSFGEFQSSVLGAKRGLEGGMRVCFPESLTPGGTQSLEAGPWTSPPFSASFSLERPTQAALSPETSKALPGQKPSPLTLCPELLPRQHGLCSNAQR